MEKTIEQTKVWSELMNRLPKRVPREDEYLDSRDGLIHCKACGDARQMRLGESLPWEPNPVVSRSCLCEQKAINDRENQRKEAEARWKTKDLRKLSLMDGRMLDAKFACYTERKENAEALRLAKAYVEHFDERAKEGHGLMLYGTVGTGKSYTAACIANALLDKGVPAGITSFPKILELYEGPMDEKAEHLKDLMYRATLLIVDDLGAERSTDWALEKVYDLVDFRYGKKLPLILTTNLTLQDMQQEKDIRYKRIYDRIFEMCCPVEMFGTSFRLEKAADNYDSMQAMADEEWPGLR